MVGKNYCTKNGFVYIEKNDNITEADQMHESEVIVIALDYSSSMDGAPWDSAVE